MGQPNDDAESATMAEVGGVPSLEISTWFLDRYDSGNLCRNGFPSGLECEVDEACCCNVSNVLRVLDRQGILSSQRRDLRHVKADSRLRWRFKSLPPKVKGCMTAAKLRRKP